jgi:hypothetical protein
MESNTELRTAWEFVEHTGVSIFLTGKAGTGKTTFLKTVKEHSSKRLIVVAPTGVAAINAGGTTIHSFFQLPLAPFIPGADLDTRFNFSKTKRHIIATLDMLVIDEISMVRADLLDAVDVVLRRYRDASKPFGGVQLVMIGDLQQLTPVVTPQDEALLGNHYATPYFFDSHALKLIPYVTIQLSHVYRQQDQTFVDILNHIRDGRPTADDMARLNARCKPAFMPKPEEGFIRLTTHNRMADDYNQTELRNLRGKAFGFKATIKGKFPEYSYPTDVDLSLKVGAQVMFVKNDPSGQHLYYNGRIGHVVGFTAQGIDVKCPGDSEPIHVEPQQWENNTYTLNPDTKAIEAKVEGTFTQYPLRLAWAITIHKSQGLTFDHAIIDAGRAFASGQVYVALSRCKTLEGLVLSTPITTHAIINDQRVDSYIAHQQEAAQESFNMLDNLKEEYFRSQVMDLFNFTPLMGAEQKLYRHLSQYFFKFQQLILLHGRTIAQLDHDVMSVANKWLNMVRQMPAEKMRQAPFLDRIKRGADYFLNAVKSPLKTLLDATKMANSQNKAATDRLDEIYKELWTLYLAKIKTLRTMSERDFSTSVYLRVRQEAMLEAIDEVNPGSGSSRRRRYRQSSDDNPYDTVGEPLDKSATKKKAAKGTHEDHGSEKEETEKKKTESTLDVTLSMIHQGLKIEEIAKERHLKPTTIYHHCLQLVDDGRLELTEVMESYRISTIRKINDALGEAPSLTEVKEHCPDDFTFDELRLVLRSKKKEKGKEG